MIIGSKDGYSIGPQVGKAVLLYGSAILSDNVKKGCCCGEWGGGYRILFIRGGSWVGLGMRVEGMSG